jgi:4'-phosphopantetheinyl transferase
MPDPRNNPSTRVWPLSRHVVDVWRADLALQSDRLAHLLTTEECIRAMRFVQSHDQYRWIGARGILRILLGRYAGMKPQAIRFVTGPHGKLALANGPRELCFNLSHAGDVAVYAFTLGSAVGIDVELPRRRIDIAAVASRVFGSDVAFRLSRLDRPAREKEFLRAWVRYEAGLKCRGMGIGSVEVATTHRPLLSIKELDVGIDGAIAALALEGMPREVRQWTCKADDFLKC